MSGAQLVSSSAQLLQLNVKLEEKYTTCLADKTLRETFLWAVGHAEDSVVDNLKKVHRISEKQTWVWTVEGLCLAAKWEQLEKFGRSLKKSPPLIEACCKYGNVNLAGRFLDKLTAYEEQVKAFILLGRIVDAATLAAKKSDLNTLQQIRRRFAHDSEEWRQVSNIIQQVDR
uniref:Vps16 C-terminal domain-containing protein n=1 Tax=Ditylenchus dipsaci TaxID=166011 RepID=A0A915DEH8_9BILA